MIHDLLTTSKDIFDQSARLCARSEQERHKLANLLELIGHLVNDAANQWKQGKLAASKSQQLELLSEELYFRLAFSLGEIKARALAHKLRDGYAAGQQPGDLNESQSIHHHLSILEAAAGYFLATSDQLRMA